MSLAATVILPTSIDRGPTLILAAESVLRQTVSDLELFIIGDGVHDSTRQAINELLARDARVRFFDHPKGTGRGETHRHAALQEARGRIVCYQVDRDLWFPDHLAEMSRLLNTADFAVGLIVRSNEDGWDFSFNRDYSNPIERHRRIDVPLAFGAHTLEAYHRLPIGWGPTPPNEFTDSYFWGKFIRNSSFRCVSGLRLTVLNFPRGKHPGWSTDQRLAAMQPWSQLLAAPHGCADIRLELGQSLAAYSQTQSRRLRYWFLICAEPFSIKACVKIWWKIRLGVQSHLLRRPPHPITRVLLSIKRRR
jgi:GalNAc5-diNAcBac-PP-undecaprenol beta-1,3-glucosyltransferase